MTTTNLVITFTDSNKNIAEYHERWETIYVDAEFNKNKLDKIKDDLNKEGKKVVHVIMGNK